MPIKDMWLFTIANGIAIKDPAGADRLIARGNNYSMDWRI